MQIEYEATFSNINKQLIRQKLKQAKAILVRPEFLQKRTVFSLPKGHEINGGWARVRDEGDKITLSVKIIDGSNIEDQKEICLQVDNFKQAKDILGVLGCVEKAYQENKREVWNLNNVEITIDEWPFLEPFVEIEGKSEKAVIVTAKKVGFNYKNALFCAVGKLYSKKYNLPENVINNKTPEIIFDMKNPFI